MSRGRNGLICNGKRTKGGSGERLGPWLDTALCTGRGNCGAEVSMGVVHFDGNTKPEKRSGLLCPQTSEPGPRRVARGIVRLNRQVFRDSGNDP